MDMDIILGKAQIVEFTVTRNMTSRAKRIDEKLNVVAALSVLSEMNGPKNVRILIPSAFCWLSRRAQAQRTHFVCCFNKLKTNELMQ